jgi:hypothetical protein
MTRRTFFTRLLGAVAGAAVARKLLPRRPLTAFEQAIVGSNRNLFNPSVDLAAQYRESYFRARYIDPAVEAMVNRDLQFVAGDQWPADVRALRAARDHYGREAAKLANLRAVDGRTWR